MQCWGWEHACGVELDKSKDSLAFFMTLQFIFSFLTTDTKYVMLMCMYYCITRIGTCGRWPGCIVESNRLSVPRQCVV